MFAAIRGAKEQADQVLDYTAFIKAAAILMTTSNRHEAVALADRLGDVKVKAAVNGATTTGSGLTNFGTLVGSFMTALRNVSAFDTILAAAMRFPMNFNGRVVVAANVAASSVAEGAAKPVRALTLGATDFTPTKIAAQVVLSKELIDGLTDTGIRILGQELRASVAAGSDAALLTALAGNSSEAMGADSWQGVCDDLEDLMRTVRLGAGSRPFFITTPQIAKELAAQAMANGVTTISWDGGEFGGIPILVSDSWTADSISLVDASSLAIAASEIGLRSSDQAALQMDDAGNMTSGASVQAANLVSMWQTNSRAIMAEREFAIKAVRANAYAHLTGVNLGATGDSPVVTP